MPMTPEQSMKVFAAFNGTCDDIIWHVADDFASITVSVFCSDVFFWGSADAEEITHEDIPALEQAIKDADEATMHDSPAGGRYGFGSIYGPILWVARKRKERPQGAFYPKKHPELWPLFDAAGEEKPVGFGNPYKPGEYPRD